MKLKITFLTLIFFAGSLSAKEDFSTQKENLTVDNMEKIFKLTELPKFKKYVEGSGFVFVKESNDPKKEKVIEETLKSNVLDSLMGLTTGFKFLYSDNGVKILRAPTAFTDQIHWSKKLEKSPVLNMMTGNGTYEFYNLWRFNADKVNNIEDLKEDQEFLAQFTAYIEKAIKTGLNKKYNGKRKRQKNCLLV